MLHYVCTVKYSLYLHAAADVSARKVLATFLAAECASCLCHTYDHSPKHTIQPHEMVPSGKPLVNADSNNYHQFHVDLPYVALNTVCSNCSTAADAYC